MNRVQIKFIKDSLDAEDQLNEWESQFINDLANRGDDYELSPKQNHTLNQIQRKLSGVVTR